MRVRGIERGLIEGINESARSVFPQEFLCMLRAEDGVISELVLLPGTVYGDSHSFLNTWMAPADLSIVGSVHSHPGHSNEPSEADVEFFGHYGGVHIITCLPYDMDSWKAYNSKGQQVRLDVVDSL